MDKTGLFYQMPPDRSLQREQTAGLKGDKTRMTLALTTNADGSDIREPVIIGHAHMPRCFEGKTGQQHGFDYHNNKTAWMTGTIFCM